MTALTPAALAEMESRARNMQQEYGDGAVIIIRTADALAMLAYVRELEAENARLNRNLARAEGESAAYHDSIPDEVWDIITGGAE